MATEPRRHCKLCTVKLYLLLSRWSECANIAGQNMVWMCRYNTATERWYVNNAVPPSHQQGRRTSIPRRPADAFNAQPTGRLPASRTNIHVNFNGNRCYKSTRNCLKYAIRKAHYAFLGPFGRSLTAMAKLLRLMAIVRLMTIVIRLFWSDYKHIRLWAVVF